MKRLHFIVITTALFLSSAAVVGETTDPRVSEEHYLETFGFNEDCLYNRYELEVSGYRVVLHSFTPPSEIRRSILYIHGFLDHTGVNSNIINYLLSRGFQVFSPDLPGHGLSSGGRGEINDYHTFGDMVQALLDHEALRKNPPEHIIGHSMGSSVIMDYLSRYKNAFSSVSLICPLVRSVMWRLSLVGETLADPFIDTVPRQFGQSSTDEVYNHFVRYDDPLRITRVPLSWFVALKRWQTEIDWDTPTGIRVNVLFAGDDTVVDNDYNFAKINNRFTIERFAEIPGARHSIFNESEPLRQKAFGVLDGWLLPDPVSP